MDLDSILQIENNDLLAEFTDGALTICCYDLINLSENISYKTLTANTETYLLEGKVQNVTVYRKAKSFIKTYYNRHSKVNRLDLVSGIIYSNDILTNPEIKIGMMKDNLLAAFFKPSEVFAKTNRLKIFENELGDAWTIFIFRDNKLAEIQFDSSYDWIKKEL